MASTRRRRRIVSVAHSYCVAQNRRLAHEMARVGAADWEVTAIAPRFMHGDLRPIPLEAIPGEQSRLEPVSTHLSRRIHVMFYGPRLRRILSEKWDLVHCWEEPYILAGAQVARWSPSRAAFVFWTAQNLAKRYPPPFSWMERYCLERSSGWLACGRSVVDTLLPRGYSARPHRIAPLGIDTEVYRPDPALRAEGLRRLEWSPDGPPIVGYLGRFVPEKGVNLMMRVLDRLATPWRAVFVGGGSEEAALRSWAERHGSRVRIVLGVPHDDVPIHLNAMDLLCAPSQTIPNWREQLGRMIIEAFACGVPVIGSDSGEIPHVIGDAGIVVGEADEEGWLRQISEVLEDPRERQAMVERGIARARHSYSWPTIARSHLDFFSEILDGRQCSGNAA